MAKDRKTKAGSTTAKLKTGEKIRRSASKSNGKHTGKKTVQATARDKTTKRKPPAIKKVTRRAQEDLIGTRQRLLATYEHAPIGIAECSPEGKYVNCNEEFCHITGYSKEELVNLWIKDLTHEEDYIFDIKLHQRLVAGAIPFYKLEKRVIRKDGEIIWVELTRNVVRDVQGKALFTIGALLDVTERKKAEESLQLAREQAEHTADRMARLQRVTAALSEALTPSQVAEIVVHQGAPALGAITSSMMVLAEDGQTLEMVHTTSQEALTRPYQHFPISLNNPAGDAARSGQPVWLESRQQYLERYPHLADQIKLWNHEAAIAIPMVNQGRTLGVLTLSFDRALPYTSEDMDYVLTLAQQGAQALERARAEERLRASEESFRSLAAAMPSMVWTAEPDGTIRYANDKWYEYTGISPEENAKNWPVVLHPDDYERCIREWTHALETGPDEYLIEVRNRRYDGQYRWFQTRAVPARDASGKVTAWYGVTTDIHERIEAENRLALLAGISEMLRNVEDPHELMYMISKAVGEHLQVKRVLFNEIDLEHDREFVHRDYHNGLDSVAGIHKVSDYSSITSAEVTGGRTVINTDSKTDPRTAQDYEKSYAPNGERAYVVVPMMRDYRWVASLWVSDDAPRQWSKEEVSLLETIAERTWTVIEKLRINTALRQSEERFARFMQYLPGLAWIKDVQGHYIYANAAAEKAFRTPREQLYGKTDEEIFQLETAAQFKKNDQQALIEGTGVQTIEILEHDDGVLHYSLVNKFTIPGPDGEAAWIGGTAFDITERKQAEEKVIFQANLLSAVGSAVIATDLNGTVLYWNPAAEKLYGWSASDALGKNILAVAPAPQSQEQAQEIMEQLARGNSWSGEFLVQRRDGRTFPAFVSDSPILDSNRKLVGIIGVSSDITDRKKAEEALRESEEWFRAIVDQATAGIVRHGVDGRLTFVNQTFCDMLGYTEAELVGQPVWQFTHKDDIQENKRLFDRLMSEGLPFKLEKRLVRKDGSILWVDVSASPIFDAAGRPYSTVAVEVDITDRKKAEQALQELNLQLENRVRSRTVELQIANQTLTEEINERKQAEEALRDSRQHLQVLSKRLVEVQEEERRAIARELHDRVGQTLAALNINLIIMNSQLPEEAIQRVGSRMSDSMQLTTEAIALVRNVMTDLRPAVLDDYGLQAALQSYIDEYKSRYSIEVLLDQPETAIPRLDPGLEMTVLRIAQEALTNVARHSQAGRATVSLRLADHTIHLTVEDDGVGMEAPQGASRPDSHGLKIMRERAEAFGGSIQVGPAPGKGTRVEARIPVESRAQNRVQKETGE